MKGVVLAGGKGTRLRPLTYTKRKQLIPIANKPIVEYAIDDLREAGITEIGVVLGNEGRDQIQSHLGDGSDFGVDITYIVQGDALGLAHAVGCARDFVDDQPFVVYLGDNMFQNGINQIVQGFDPDEYAAGIAVRSVEEPSRYGVVDIESTGDVRRIVEKPVVPPSNLAVTGVYILTAPIFDQIASLSQSDRGEFELTDALHGLLERGYDIETRVLDGWWKDIGTPTDVTQANRFVLEELVSGIDGTAEDNGLEGEQIRVGKGSTIKNGATIQPPVAIGENTTIGSGAVIGPYTSIGDDSTIDNARIESSVVIGDATITADRQIVNSLLGRTTEITQSDDPDARGVRLVVGPDSEVWF